MSEERSSSPTTAGVYHVPALLRETVDSLITDHPLYWALGNTPFDRQRAYKELCEQPLDERQADQLQQATLKGWVLGGEHYREWAARTANRRVSPLPRGRPRKVRENTPPIQQ